MLDDITENFYEIAICQGHLSYLTMAAHAANPNFLSGIVGINPYKFLFGSILLGNSVLIYSKKAMRPLRKNYRLIFSIGGSLMFSTVSVLTWSWFHSAFPERAVLAPITSLLVGKLMYKLFDTYLCYVDSVFETDETEKAKMTYLLNVF